MPSALTPFAGLAIGVFNGLFGAGGGIVAVYYFQKRNLSEKASHATAIPVMLFLSAVSGWFYWYNGHVSLQDVWIFLPGAVLGAVFGGWLLPKISDFWLRKIFSVFILYAAIRLFFK